ncbi:hypothetical protein EW145_g4774 [Phellinidium pouzarii]|uniref:Zeta-coat protein n=1 Tax=Phellinidium pouzarii TaxID=167371 RepID=A0A4S4L2I2_9AGAM|nr:hypothetical protein EW145_g4774 [Phellinidium pouzarii]
MLNLTLYTTTTFLILDSDGQRVLAKYYRPKGLPYGDSKGLTTVKEQKSLEKGLWEKTKKPGGGLGDIILYDGHLAVYKHSPDLIFYIIGDAEQNELMLSLALNSFYDALSVLLHNQIEKRAVLESYDLVMLCLDETIDDGIIVETDSTTIASRYARVNSPNLSNRSLDFCNAFWGTTDGGVDVLFARMRGAGRTVEEVRSFWKERATIEEDYAKRLSKLAKQTLGKDEIGELKNSLDTLRLETDRQATSHVNLSQQIRSELETPATAFVARQAQFKRNAQSIIEKAYKNKQTQEAYVTKAREKYEADCMRINSYTAQSTLVQGRDLDKIQLKLDRAKQTVTANERDFANFARALQGTVEKWERDWKAFCDACQDLEEERIEFMKDNVWAYANAVSTVCVSDDESCEKIRISLEQLEPERDMENFVRDYGTGNEIPEPPQFISYTNPETAMAAQSRPESRYANFPRSSSRHMSMTEAMRAPPPEEEPDGPGMAGFGAIGSTSARNGDLERSNTLGGQSRPSSASPVNGIGGSSTSAAFPSSSQATHGAHGPSEGGVYEVYPEQDPQPAPNSAGSAPPPGSSHSRVGAENDPLAKKMEELRISAAATGPVRRNSANVPRPNSGYQSASPVPVAGPGPSSTTALSGALAAPNPSKAQPGIRDYRDPADLIVGGPPPSSRPTSPAGPPTAAHMMPPSQKSSSPLPVEEVLSTYAPSLPGERRTPLSRSNSPGIGSSHTHSQSLGQNINRVSTIERPKSREGFAGIGSGGRTPSPGVGPGPSGSAGTGGNQNNYRIPSPAPDSGNLGIALDASGQVTHDLMAEQYRNQQQQQQQSVSSHISYGVPQRSHSVQMSSPVGPPPQPQPQQQQSYVAPPPAVYPQQPPYTQQTIPSAQGTGVQRQSSIWYNQQPQPQPQYVHTPPIVNSYAPPGPNGSHVQRGPSVSMRTPSYSNGVSYQNTGYNDPVQTRRSPSPAPMPMVPAPTGQYIDGKPVLFYVKALYDYQASIDEEFDFQSGDVIAVTSTPEDGWWTGVLLDDSRRIPGRTVFPSNFVCLF